MGAFIAVLAVIFIIILGAYGYLNDVVKVGKINWRKLLVVSGIVLAAVAFNVIDQLNKDTSISNDKRESRDSLNSKTKHLSSQLDTVGASLADTTKQSERRIIDSLRSVAEETERRYERYRDSVGNNQKPLIDIYAKNGGPNPVFVSTDKKDSFSFINDIINDGAIAKWFTETVTFVAYTSGQFSSNILKKDAQTNEGRILSKTSTAIRATLTVSTTNLEPQDTVFVCIAVGYSDTKGIRYLPIHLIFRYTDKQWNVTLPDATKDQYTAVKKYLIENKLWDFRL
jgi:hypothetical protein